MFVCLWISLVKILSGAKRLHKLQNMKLTTNFFSFCFVANLHTHTHHMVHFLKTNFLDSRNLKADIFVEKKKKRFKEQNKLTKFKSQSETIALNNVKFYFTIISLPIQNTTMNYFVKQEAISADRISDLFYFFFHPAPNNLSCSGKMDN